MNWLNKLDDVLDSALRPAVRSTSDGSSRDSGGVVTTPLRQQQPQPQQRESTTAAAATPTPLASASAAVAAVAANQQQTPPPSQSRASTTVNENNNSTPGRLKRGGPTTNQSTVKAKRMVGPTTRIASSFSIPVSSSSAAAAATSSPRISMDGEQQPTHPSSTTTPAAAPAAVVPDDQPLIDANNQTGPVSATPLVQEAPDAVFVEPQNTSSAVDNDGGGDMVTMMSHDNIFSTMPRAAPTTPTITAAARSRPRSGPNTPGLVRKKKPPTAAAKKIKIISTTMIHANNSSSSSPLSSLLVTPADVSSKVYSQDRQQQQTLDMDGRAAAPVIAAASAASFIEPSSPMASLQRPTMQQQPQTTVSSLSLSSLSSHKSNELLLLLGDDADHHETIMRSNYLAEDGHDNGMTATTATKPSSPRSIPPSSGPGVQNEQLVSLSSATSIATLQDHGEPSGAAERASMLVVPKRPDSSGSGSSSIESSSALEREQSPARTEPQEEEEPEADTSFVTIPLSDDRGDCSLPKTTYLISPPKEEKEGETEPIKPSSLFLSSKIGTIHNNNDNHSEDRNQHDTLLLLSASGVGDDNSLKSPVVAANQTGKDDEKRSNPLILLNPQEHTVENSFHLEKTKPQSPRGDVHHESDIAERSTSTARRQIPVPVVQEDRILQGPSMPRESGPATLTIQVDKPNNAKHVAKDQHDPQMETAQVGKNLTQSRDPLLGGIESMRQSRRRPSLERTPSSAMRGDDLSSVSGVESSFPLFRSDFEIDRLLSAWDEEAEQPHCPPWDPRMNCYGVVHVRVLRAQRLPCPVGSSIHAVVSLPPWKGMVRTRKAKSFAGSSRKRGVCTDWTEMEASAISMVHAYSSNEESPVPSIHVDVMMSTLGMFEFKICSLTLPCETLLRSPLVPRRSWFLTCVPQDCADSKHIPLLQIEALFEPDEKNLPLPSPLSTAIPMNIVSFDSRDSLSISLREDDEMPPVVSEPPTHGGAVSTNLDDDEVQSSQQSVDVAPSGPTPVVDGLQQHSITAEHTDSVYVKSIGSSTKSGAVLKPAEAVSLLPASALLDDDQSMAELSVSLQSLRRQESVASSANAHLLRLQKYYKPASCAVCKRSIMSVWRKKAYHCEACGVDCCSDCRLQIDVQLVCGSEEARVAVEDAIQSKFTSDKILRLVAPIDECDAELDSALRTSPSYQQLGDHNESGIGVLKIDILQAIVLANPLPADSNAVDDADCLRSGDFYVRVSRNGTERNARTRTVQNSSGHPKFDAEEILLRVPNYATEFRIEVVDASTDQPVGATLLTTQGLLQEQRDLMTEGRIRPSSFGPFSFKGKRRIKTELRTGLKTGFGTNFFPDVKQRTSATGPQPGGVVGMIEVAVGLEEDFDALYGTHPYECPARPTGELDLNVIQGHIVRLSFLVDDMKSLLNSYAYVISWENPFVTALSLALFVRFCFWYDPAHTGASSIFLLLVYMVYLAFLRFHGNIKHRFVERELSLYKKKAKVEQTQHALYRPVGLIRSRVARGKNLRSPELGLPGNAGCHVYLDLTRFMDSEDAKELQLLDESVASPHDMGSTEHMYATNPTWKQLVESDEAKRLRQLLPTHGSFFEVSTPKEQGDDELLEFPVLQPLDHTSHDSLMPWSSSTAAVVFEVKLYDVLQLLPGSEYSLGEVVVPLSTLAERGEISGWFKLDEPGKAERLNAPNKADLELDTDAPQVLVYLRWGPPQSIPQLPPETEREASVVIHEELVKSATLNRQSKLGVVGSSIGAINSMRALSGHLLVVQNALGMVLDAIESIRNGFNFTDPFKSSVLFAVLSFVCLILTIVPTRAIILTVGVLQHVVTFKSRFGRLFMGRNEPTVKAMEAQSKVGEKSPVATWVMNALRGLPTDVDLKRTYHWETRRLVALEVESQAEQKRTSRLRRLWRAQWYASVQLAQMQGTSLELTPVFAMIQGHRFLWWRSVEDFDQGEGALGRIFLQGHAGLASPSPLELKAVQKEDLARFVGIFGRGADKQERLTLLCSSEAERGNFEKAISNALTTKND